MTYNRYATNPLGSQLFQRAGVWQSVRVSGLNKGAGPTWFSIDSAGGGGATTTTQP